MTRRVVACNPILLCAAVLVVLAACGRPRAPEARSTETTMHRFLALGDSYTIGESVAESDRWPVQLVAALRSEGIDIADPEIIATTGWTTDELSRGIDQADPHGPYALVSLLIGVNNQYRGRDAEEYRGELAALLERARAFAGGNAAHVLVLSIPDWGVTPFAKGRDATQIGADIDHFNAINREESARIGAAYVDVTAISRRAIGEPGLIAADGLHPSAAMYHEWAAVALPSARAILR